MCQCRGYEDEIDPMEWLRMEKENASIIFMAGFCFYNEAKEWWMSLDEGTGINSTWEVFEKFFLN